MREIIEFGAPKKLQLGYHGNKLTDQEILQITPKKAISLKQINILGYVVT